MGFSSWNHFGMMVTAPLLLDQADAILSTGLQAAGYVYINTDDGWNSFNRSRNGGLQPSSHFSANGTYTMNALTDALHANNFKFGIYGAAGFTTCGRRAGP
jgi:alpha-galactosidase